MIVAFGTFSISAALALTLNVGGMQTGFGYAAVGQVPADDVVERVKAKFKLGRAAYETSNYSEAVKHFEGAYLEALEIEDDAFKVEVFYSIMFNLGRAHVKAYGHDSDVVHLQKARDLFQKFMEATRDETERDEAQVELAEVDRMIYEAKQVEAPEPPPDDGPETTTVVGNDRDTADQPDKGGPNGLAIGGYAAIGVGAIGLGLLGGGMAMGNGGKNAFLEAATAMEREDADSKGRLGNVLAIAGGVTAAVGIGAGVALVVLAAKKKNSETARVKLAPSPMVLHRGGGLGVLGRF